MKKSLLAIAVAATMAAPAAVMAAPTVYGNLHLSINAADNDAPDAENNIQMSSNTSAIGVKGSEDLGDGLKAIYKVEFQVLTLGPANPFPDEKIPGISNLDGTDAFLITGALTGRDQFVGLKGGWGTIKFGTMSSNYKQMGGKVDPLYRTPLEGRYWLEMQSPLLHAGKGIHRGRSTNTVQYVSPKMAGVSLVANGTVAGVNDETYGIGLRWSNKAFLVYGDWIQQQVVGFDDVPQLKCDSNAIPALSCDVESAYKIGGKWSGKHFALAAQYESAEDIAGADYVFGAGTWNINKNNALILTAGQKSLKEDNDPLTGDSTSYALAYNHKMSKLTNVYVGYGAKSNDTKYSTKTEDGETRSNVFSGDQSMFTVGIRKKF